MVIQWLLDYSIVVQQVCYLRCIYIIILPTKVLQINTNALNCDKSLKLSRWKYGDTYFASE